MTLEIRFPAIVSRIPRWNPTNKVATVATFKTLRSTPATVTSEIAFFVRSQQKPASTGKLTARLAKSKTK